MPRPAYRAANRERLKVADRKADLVKKYGITTEYYDAMLRAQEGVCAICGNHQRGKRLSVDHCHDTNKVRGLLCNHCNVAIGHFRDDPLIVRRAATYLEESQ